MRPQEARIQTIRGKILICVCARIGACWASIGAICFKLTFSDNDSPDPRDPEAIIWSRDGGKETPLEDGGAVDLCGTPPPLVCQRISSRF